jgi:hypothetical protein
MQPKLSVPVLQSRRQFFGPLAATAIGNHNDLFLSVAKDGHDLMDILAQPLRLKMGDNLIDDARGAILHRAYDLE